MLAAACRSAPNEGQRKSEVMKTKMFDKIVRVPLGSKIGRLEASDG